MASLSPVRAQTQPSPEGDSSDTGSHGLRAPSCETPLQTGSRQDLTLAPRTFLLSFSGLLGSALMDDGKSQAAVEDVAFPFSTSHSASQLKTCILYDFKPIPFSF